MLSLIALAAATAAQPTPLWQNVNVGMTLQQLQGVRPAVHELTAAEKSQYLGECTHADANVTVNDVDFSVCYTLVSGSTTAAILYGNKANDTRASEFKSMLAQKYGAPVLDTCGEEGCDTTWKQGATTIELHRNANFGTLNLYYRAATANPDASKL